jgi:hypothetical protein
MVPPDSWVCSASISRGREGAAVPLLTLLRPGSHVRLPGIDNRRILDRRQCFQRCAALGLRPKRQPHEALKVRHVLLAQAPLGEPHKQTLQRRCLVDQHRLGMGHVAPLHRRRLLAQGRQKCRGINFFHQAFRAAGENDAIAAHIGCGHQLRVRPPLLLGGRPRLAGDCLPREFLGFRCFGLRTIIRLLSESVPASVPGPRFESVSLAFGE